MKNKRITVRSIVRLSLNPDTMAHEGPSITPAMTGQAVLTVNNRNGSQVTLVMPTGGGLGWVLTHELIELE